MIIVVKIAMIGRMMVVLVAMMMATVIMVVFGHLKNLFFASSPEPKGQLTCSLVGSIGMICRSKIAKIIPIRNPKGQLT